MGTRHSASSEQGEHMKMCVHQHEECFQCGDHESTCMTDEQVETESLLSSKSSNCRSTSHGSEVGKDARRMDAKQRRSSLHCVSVGIVFGIVFTIRLFLIDQQDGRATVSLAPEHHHHEGIGPNVTIDVDSFCEGRSRKECPSVSKFVKSNHRIKGDISWMLDFAVIGNAKCGTSFLLRYLGNSTETLIPDHEVCKMSKNRPDELAQLYFNASLVSGKYQRYALENGLIEENDLSKGDTLRETRPQTINGLKCPKETATELGLRNYARFFPNLKYIVTTRHPVLWFQSFYNYRVYGNGRLPPPDELIGACVEDSPYICSKRCAFKTTTQNVCTDRAKFHHQLSRFGKTPLNTREEIKLLHHKMDIVKSNGTIFLMDLAQLFPSEKASRNLPRDLSKFLGLQHELPRLEDVPPDSSRYTDKKRKKYFIKICDKQHKGLRKVLTDIGKEAYVWIRDYFLKSPDVFVSSKEDFLELISKWGDDPCDQ